MKTDADIANHKRKTDAEIEAMHTKAKAEIEISQRKATTDSMIKAAQPKPAKMGKDGKPVPQQQDNSAAVLGPLLVELTHALKALSAPKQIVYSDNGEPIGVRPMVN
jgi:hypothetical protein